MSCHVIEYVQGRKVMRPVGTAQEYRDLRAGTRQQTLLDELRRAYDRGDRSEQWLAEHKRRLLQMNYSCLPAPGGLLKGSRTASDSVAMDTDFDPADPDYEAKLAAAPQTILAKADELGLLMMERSVRKGYHIAFRRHTTEGLAEGRLLENQELNLQWASRLLGVAYDKGARDVTRVFFTTGAGEDDLLFLSDALFEQGGEGAIPSSSSPDSAGSTPSASSKDSKDSKNSPDSKESPAPPAEEEPCYDGIPYSRIVAKYWQLYNDGREPQQGDRNVKTYELAMNLRAVCDYRQELMERVIPRYDGFQEEEWRTTIANALKEPRKGMPYRMRQLLDALKADRRRQYFTVGRAADEEPSGTDSMPQRPQRMPAMLELLSSKVPDELKPMVEEAVWPAVCAHISGVKFRYVDGVLHEPNISSALIGRQSTGKGHVNAPIEMLLADITERDEANRRREEEWRAANRVKGASKDKQPRPQDIVVQRLDDDLTTAALSQALIDAERNGERRVITKVDEIELLNKVGNGKNETVGLLVRYGFDTSRWGQRRVGLESVNGCYTVRWVWNASCTPKSARRFITADWIANGSLSRLNLNALLLPRGNREMPRVGTYDEQFAGRLKVFVDRLSAASGVVECPEADALAEEMLQEHNRVADLCESEGYRVMSYRAVVIGWMKALLLFIADGCQWDRCIADYVRYAVRRDLWLKMYFFGEQIEEEFAEEEQKSCRGPQNMLAGMPKEFTMEEFQTVRARHGKTGDGRSTIRSWLHRGYIVFDETANMYVKK